MTERLPGMYEASLTTRKMSVGEIKIFLIPGKKGERSLMIDAGFREKPCLEKMEKVLAQLGIEYGMLDVFLTHKHHDHTGLATEYLERGARLFMNPAENRHSYDCLYYSHNRSQSDDQFQVLRSVGVTPEETPEIWEMFMEIRRMVAENRGWETEEAQFTFLPITEGQAFDYGDYHFTAVPLRGHTFGQMGLYEKEKRLLFCADQVIDGIVPIVGTTFPDEHLLQGYFSSLEQFRHEYADCLLFPAHNEPIREVKRIVDRIVFAYIDKTNLIKHILDHGRRRMTVKEVACLAYGMRNVPANSAEFIKLKMIMSKTFSCLEYLADKDFVIRTQENGTFYWESP